MNLIIAGSRNIDTLSKYWFRDTLLNFKIDCRKLADPIQIYEIISGGAKGVDSCGEKFASSYLIPKKIFPANWKNHGKAAGPIRNKQMAEYADALLLIWDGESRGSASMKREMEKLNKPVYEVILKTNKTG